MSEFPIHLTAERLMLAGGIAAFLLTLHWIRRRDLREKYAIVWFLVATILLVTGFSPELLKAAATASRLSYPAAVLFVALGVVYVFSLTVSVSLSRQYRRVIRCIQELALLESGLLAPRRHGQGPDRADSAEEPEEPSGAREGG